MVQATAIQFDMDRLMGKLEEGLALVVQVKGKGPISEMPKRTIIASHTVERVVPAEGTEILDVVHAFDTALGKVMKSIVQWALKAPG